MQSVMTKKLLGLAAAGLLAAACTGATEQIAPSARLIQVADKMEEVQTAHFTTEGSVSTQTVPAGTQPGGGESQQPAVATNFRGEGDIQFPNRQQAEVTVSNGGSITTQVVRIGDQVWAYDPTKREWVQGQVSVTDQLQQMGPVQTVGLLRVASQDISTVGQEQVDGSNTTHYKATLDPTRTRELIARQNQQLANSIERVDGTIDLWVTDDNLLRQMHPDLTFTLMDPNIPSDQRTRLHTAFTVTLSEFNQPVNIQEPTNGMGGTQPGQPQQQMQPGQTATPSSPTPSGQTPTPSGGGSNGMTP